MQVNAGPETNVTDSFNHNIRRICIVYHHFDIQINNL